MNGLPVLVLLCAAAAASPPALERVTCNEGGQMAAARLAAHHINQQHDHGYKFKLSEVQSSKYEQVKGGCNIDLRLELLETTCHVVNFKHFEECETREEHDTSVKAICAVMMTVADDEAKVTRYECSTQRVNSNLELAMVCPDCPSLIALNSQNSLTAAHLGTSMFNDQTNHIHKFALQEVARVKSGYIMNIGMQYYVDFVLVETTCQKLAKMAAETCPIMCPDRATRVYCKGSYSAEQRSMNINCELYPPSNTTALGPGEDEPTCDPPRHMKAHNTLPVEGGTSSPSVPDSDPALHPINPWPEAVALPMPLNDQ